MLVNLGLSYDVVETKDGKAVETPYSYKTKTEAEQKAKELGPNYYVTESDNWGF